MGFTQKKKKKKNRPYPPPVHKTACGPASPHFLSKNDNLRQRVPPSPGRVPSPRRTIRPNDKPRQCVIRASAYGFHHGWNASQSRRPSRWTGGASLRRGYDCQASQFRACSLTEMGRSHGVLEDLLVLGQHCGICSRCPRKWLDGCFRLTCFANAISPSSEVPAL